MNDATTILNRLRKNYKNRKGLVKSEKLSAYRLYEKDIPEYPYIIDIFNDHALIYEKGKRIKEDNPEELQLQKLHRAHLIAALKEIYNFPRANIIFKERKKQKGKEQYNSLATKKYDPHKKLKLITVKEGDFDFLVNLYDYLDPGLFLDHRPLRKIIKKESHGKEVLNLFAYTGSISVAAATGGAKVTTVDMSKTYLDWAVDNFEANDLNPDEHNFIQADVLQFITELPRNTFDIVILDPPSFSNSKRMEETFDVQRDHSKLIVPIMESLRPDGILYFSNNYRKFKLDPEILDSYQVKDISAQSIPKDFRDLKIHVCFKIQKKT